MPETTQADRAETTARESEIKDLPPRDKDLGVKDAQNVKGGAGITSLKSTQACPS